MKRLVGVLLAVAAMSACGTGEEEAVETSPPSASGWPAHPEPEPGFDPDDPAISIIPDSDASRQALIDRVGDREDFKVPRDVVAGLQAGPLVLAVVVRPFAELSADDPRVARLNEGQRAVHAMYLADFEILNGGFFQFWENAGAIAGDMVRAAELVGSREFADIYRDAQALWPGGRIPGDRSRREELVERIPDEAVATLDERYVATQSRRRTALGIVLARYIRAHPEQFVAG